MNPADPRRPTAERWLANVAEHVAPVLVWFLAYCAMAGAAVGALLLVLALAISSASRALGIAGGVLAFLGMTGAVALVARAHVRTNKLELYKTARLVDTVDKLGISAELVTEVLLELQRLIADDAPVDFES